MQPIFGFVIFAVVDLIVSIIASKRNGVGTGVIYFLVIAAAAFGIVVLTSNITQGNGLIAGIAAFLSPAIGLLIAIATSTDEQKAVNSGESRDFKKCHFCAESVRKEAIKCKHCGSDLSTDAGGGDK